MTPIWAGAAAVERAIYFIPRPSLFEVHIIVALALKTHIRHPEIVSG
jgi:hypothetical protein